MRFAVAISRQQACPHLLQTESLCPQPTHAAAFFPCCLVIEVINDLSSCDPNSLLHFTQRLVFAPPLFLRELTTVGVSLALTGRFCTFGRLIFDGDDKDSCPTVVVVVVVVQQAP